MITCIAIDDEPLALKQLENYISRTPFLKMEAAFHSATEAKDFLAGNSVDAIFTDINMPECNGLQFAKDLKNSPFIVFSTAYEEYAVESFRVNAIDYLLKPYSYQDFLNAALKVKKSQKWKLAANEHTSNEPTNDYFFVRSDNQSVKVLTNTVLYVEAMSEYVRIHFKDGSKPLMTFMSIKLMMETLPCEQFMRIHRSYIIALDSIQSFRRNELELCDGTVLPVSTTYKEDLQKFIENKTVGRK